MSGLSGHMMHPHEDLKLKTADYIKLVGKLSRSSKDGLAVTEKIDGFGFQVAFQDTKNGTEPRIVRSKQDLEVGGVPLENIPARFAHNPKAAKLYAVVLQGAQQFANRNEVQYWPSTYNGDILEPGVTNVIKYGEEYRVCFHNIWARPEGVDGPVKIQEIGSEFKFVYGDAHQKYIVCTTPTATLHPMAHWAAEHFAEKLHTLIGDYDTVGDVYKHNLDLLVGEDVSPDLYNYIFKQPNKKNLKDLKKEHPMFDWSKKSLNKVYLNVVQALDKFDLEFGTELLRNVQTDQGWPGSNQESREASTGPLINDMTFEHDLYRWGLCGYRAYGIEGIVYDGYKYTGPFGPLNQILGKMRKMVE